MTYDLASHRRSEQGFTLVELAIVMVIIGLLIAGILKGQELIANARISSSVSQLKGFDAAVNTFQDKFNALPGDMLTPTTRLPNCTAAPCSTAGNGNGQIQGTLAIPAVGNEGATAFAHLGAADLISGVTPTSTSVTFGNLLPALKAGGGFWVGYANAAPAGTTLTVGRHYAVLNGSNVDVSATSGSLSAVAAAQIDRKLDDGLPNTGAVQTLGTGCKQGNGPADNYVESATAATCAMYSRILN